MKDAQHEYWSEIVKRFNSTSRSLSDFCQSENIPQWQLTSWLRTISAAMETFDEIQIIDSSDTVPVQEPVNYQKVSSGISLCKGLYRIELDKDFDPQTLSQVLEHL